MKVKVYVAWSQRNARRLEEKGTISMERVEVYEFDTQAEADAFCKAIDLTAGWDSPFWAKGSSAKEEEGELVLDWSAV